MTTYIYGGHHLLAEITTRTATSVNYPIDETYTWGTYVDELIAIIPAEGISDVLYAHQDRQYNLRGLTDSTGTLVEYYAYSPYGERTAYDSTGTEIDQVTNALLTDYGFTGRRYDVESDLWYFRARYFDTEMGRFVSRDPLGYVDGFGLYNGYFAQMFMLDPYGLAKEVKCTVNIEIGHVNTHLHPNEIQNPECTRWGAVGCYKGTDDREKLRKN